MPRYKLVLEYDGTRYSGWQVQQNARTVQGMLIAAAREGFGRVGEVMGSGRTDSGVHALEQTAHIDLPKSMPSDRILYGLNDNLPYDINVLGAVPVPAKFHARHDATGRSYLYQISRSRTAFGKPYVWWIRDDLDVGAMRRAALAATGMHDYSAFADNDPSEGSTKVLVESVEIAEAENLILIRIRASHFLRKMVRRVVGTFAEIGRGNLPVESIARALDDPSARITLTAPPSGLFLDQVKYKGESYRSELVPAVRIGR
jgi:tRNA pseudouridine38-40 synthase